MANKCLAVDLKKENILFISITPGMVDTDMTRDQTGGADPKVAIATLLSTLSRFNEDHNGEFFRLDGSICPF